MATVFPGG